MTNYTVTTSNWNDPAFWSSINETTPRHTLSFVDLPSTYSVDFDTEARSLSMSDGTTSYVVTRADLGSNMAFPDVSRVFDSLSDGERTRISGDGPDTTADSTGVVCFTKGTAIRTLSGDVLIEDLAVGDLVCTLDNGPQRLMWIGTRDVSAAQMLTQPNLRPVRLQKEAMGNDRMMMVSRQHGMLLGRDHLARAVHLSKAMPGIGVLRAVPELTYIHLMFERHQIIFAEGAPSESFYPSPQALIQLGRPETAQMKAMLPNLNTTRPNLLNSNAVYGAPAREFLLKNDVWDWACAVMPEVALAG